MRFRGDVGSLTAWRWNEGRWEDVPMSEEGYSLFKRESRAALLEWKLMLLSDCEDDGGAPVIAALRYG